MPKPTSTNEGHDRNTLRGHHENKGGIPEFGNAPLSLIVPTKIS